MNKYNYKNLEKAAKLIQDASEILYESYQFPDSPSFPNELLMKQAEFTVKTALALINETGLSERIKL